jgi:hypothetical protein
MDFEEHSISLPVINPVDLVTGLDECVESIETFSLMIYPNTVSACQPISPFSSECRHLTCFDLRAHRLDAVQAQQEARAAMAP